MKFPYFSPIFCLFFEILTRMPPTSGRGHTDKHLLYATDAHGGFPPWADRSAKLMIFNHLS